MLLGKAFNEQGLPLQTHGVTKGFLLNNWASTSAISKKAQVNENVLAQSLKFKLMYTAVRLTVGEVRTSSIGR